MGTSAAPDNAPEVLLPDESVQPSAAVDENKLDRNPTASATVKLLRGVRDSAGASTPLKSIAESLCYLLENCEVRPPSRTLDRLAYSHSSKQGWIRKP